MLARLDKPLRPADVVKTAEAQSGEDYVAIASKREPWNRCLYKVGGQTPGLADFGRRGGVRSQRHRTQELRHVFQFLARASMGAIQRRLSAVLVLDASRQRAYPDRDRQQHAAEAVARQY